MNWDEIAELCRSKQCEERRRYKSCSCKNKKKVNPCEQAEILARLAEKENKTEEEISILKNYIDKRRCWKSKQKIECSHFGCIKAERLLEEMEK